MCEGQSGNNTTMEENHPFHILSVSQAVQQAGLR